MYPYREDYPFNGPFGPFGPFGPYEDQYRDYSRGFRPQRPPSTTRPEFSDINTRCFDGRDYGDRDFDMRDFGNMLDRAYGRGIKPLSPSDFDPSSYAETNPTSDNLFRSSMLKCSQGLKKAAVGMASKSEKTYKEALLAATLNFHQCVGLLAANGIIISEQTDSSEIDDSSTTATRGAVGECEAFGNEIERIFGKYTGGSRGPVSDLGRLVDYGDRCWGSLSRAAGK